MSFAVDANLLIYAVNRDSEFHEKAATFIRQCAASAEQWLLPWPVITAFIRISTHPGILPSPLTPLQAIETLEQLRALPNVTLAGESEENIWELFVREISSHHLRGNAVTDALIVTIMRANGVSVMYTKDRDFLRFSGIRVVDPLK